MVLERKRERDKEREKERGERVEFHRMHSFLLPGLRMRCIWHTNNFDLHILWDCWFFFCVCCRSVNDIDLFPGGVAERAVEGGLIGPTFACILGETFRAVKQADRFWFENEGKNSFTPGRLLLKFSLFWCINREWFDETKWKMLCDPNFSNSEMRNSF